MVGIAEVLLGVGVAVAFLGLSKKLIKAKKPRYAALAVGVFLALIGAQMGGYFAFLSAAPGAGPKAGALFKAFITDASDTDRTETETVSPDQQSIVWVMNDDNMDGLGDLTVAVDILNQNIGETTDLWSGEAKLNFVGTVIVSGIPTPVANYTTDRSRFAITWTDTDASGTWLQVLDVFYSNDVVTGGGGTITLGMPIAPSVTDDLPAGGSFKVDIMVVGVLLKTLSQES